jgi:predicted alpha/beta superfamily hydrolase
MVRLPVLVFFLLVISCKSHSYSPEGKFDTIHSVNTNDDYVIQTRVPENFDATKSYNIVVAADGTIGLGEYLMGTNRNWRAELPSNCIIVTIGHRGDWEAKRRRDFIPSDVTKNREEDFGNADKFYAFLKTELLPYIDKKYPNQKTKSFVGHSFSGLFCLYAALRNENLFDHYFAISPSVWANSKELLKIEEQFAKNNKDLPASITIYVGGLEIFNKVLSSSTEFYDKLRSRAYPGLSIQFQKIGSANHFSIRKPAIDRILKAVSF